MAKIETTHKLAMDAVGFAYQLLEPQSEYLAAFVTAEQSMHSHLHITDPTLYRDAIYSDGLRQQVVLAKAALAFCAAVREIKDELDHD